MILTVLIVQNCIPSPVGVEQKCVILTVFELDEMSSLLLFPVVCDLNHPPSSHEYLLWIDAELI